MSEEVGERRDEQSRSNVVSTPTSAELEYAVVETDDGGRECTIFPRECEDDAIVTHWLTASEDAFVGLEAVR